MASVNHISKELKQLIKKIGETKSKQEEDSIVTGELYTLKGRLAEKNLAPRQTKEHLIRALYIEMLGHSAPFAHIHAVNLTQSKNLVLKRIGYLMCALFFDASSDLLIMLVATILKDLSSGDVHQIVICLTALGNLMSPTIASAISESLVRLLSHATDLVRKKALLVLQKVRQAGSEVGEYREKMKRGLCDREPSVMSASLILYLEEISRNPRKYRDLTGSFVVILKQVIEHKLPKEFDYHRHPAPWIQLKMLKLIEILGKGDQKSSEHCYTVLEHVLQKAEECSNNMSIAITYQCVRTIASIYPYEGLLNEAARAIAKFLQPSSPNNMKYLGIQALGLLMKTNSQLLERHQLMVVECLESKDETLKKETLDLLFRMTNPENIQIIVAKMLNALHGSTDRHFRNDLVLKITELAERHCTTHQWYIATMQILFELGSEYLSEAILNNFLKLVLENCQQSPAFGEHIIPKMVELVQKIVPTDFVIKAASWVLGQVGSSCFSHDPEQLNSLFAHLKGWLDCDCKSQSSKKWTIDAIMKLASAREFRAHGEVKAILEKFSRHTDLELYQRVLECRRLARYNVALRNSLETRQNFQDGLPFLKKFVQTARQNGAKQYSKVKATPQKDLNVVIAPYPTKQLTSAFENFLKEKQENKVEKKEPRTIPLSSYEARQVKSPVFVAREPPAKQKKKFVAPEERAKQTMAKSLFGGVKGPLKQPVGPKSGPPKKKIDKTETDLI